MTLIATTRYHLITVAFSAHFNLLRIRNTFEPCSHLMRADSPDGPCLRTTPPQTLGAQICSTAPMPLTGHPIDFSARGRVVPNASIRRQARQTSKNSRRCFSGSDAFRCSFANVLAVRSRIVVAVWLADEFPPLLFPTVKIGQRYGPLVCLLGS